MKTLKNSLYLILTISIIYFTFYVKKEKELRHELFFTNHKLNSELTLVKDKLNNLKLIDQLEHNNNFKTLKNIQLLEENKKKILLKNKLSNKLTLIYRYFDVNCQVCIINTLKNLSSSIVNQSQLSIIASYQTKRHLLQFKRVNNIKTNISNIENQTLIKSLDSLEIPYLLLVNKKLKIISVHILSKELKDRNNLYVNSLIEYLNKLN